MPQHITVVEYSPQWPLKYEREKEKIMAILKENCTAIYHIGSTSVPGLAAKPIIDIILERVDAVSADFSEIGYEYLGEFGISGRRYLRKGGDELKRSLAKRFPYDINGYCDICTENRKTGSGTI